MSLTWEKNTGHNHPLVIFGATYHFPETFRDCKAEIACCNLARVDDSPLEDLAGRKELLLVVLDVLDRVVLTAATGHHGKISEGFHGEEFPGKDASDPVRVGKVRLSHVNLRQDKDGPLSAL